VNAVVKKNYKAINFAKPRMLLNRAATTKKAPAKGKAEETGGIFARNSSN